MADGYIERDIYIHEKRRVEPIYLSVDSSAKIVLYLKDFQFVSATGVSYTAKCYAMVEGETDTKEYTPTLSTTNKNVILYPTEGFFRYGRNDLQVEIYNGQGTTICTLHIPVVCESRLSNGTITSTESFKTLTERAETAAQTASSAVTGLASKQDKLTAGSGISIAADGKTISTVFDATATYADGTMGKAIAQNKENIAALPDIQESNATGVDLDVSDASGNVIARFSDGHIKTKNFNSANVNVSVMDSTSEDSDLDFTDASGNVLMRLNDGEVHTKYFHSSEKIVTVKADGTGDFTSIRSAVESITDADSETNPYCIDVYKGTYNIMDDYTDAEITASGFVGLTLTDGISIRGVGNPGDVIIHGELPTTYDSIIRNNIATLNASGTMRFENLTVTANYLRYAVHDDFATTKDWYTRNVTDCVFRIKNATSGTEQKSWGEGSRQGKTTIIERCDFGTCFLWHSDNQFSSTRPTKLIMRNCKASIASISAYNHSVMHDIRLYECDFQIINHGFTNVSSTDYMMTVNGTNTGAMVSCPADYNYVNGDIARFPRNSSFSMASGKIVAMSGTPHWSGGSLAVTTNADVAVGYVLRSDDNFVYVQKCGSYLNANRTELGDDLAVGDRITIKDDSTLEVDGSGDLIGVVVMKSTLFGTFIKLRG